MMIYFDPDEAHRFSAIEAEPSAGLEALTGADFLISDLPIDPIENIGWHTDPNNRSVVVNLKIGYDALNNSDQRHKFAARVQRLGFKVSFLLGVGNYRNKDGFLQVSGYRSNDKVPYATFQQMKLNEVARGVTWDSIETLEDLPGWIKSVAKMMELPAKNVVFSKSQYPLYEWYDDEKISDPWQSMEELDPESVQSIMACGLPGFGPKRIRNVIDYLIQNHYPVCVYTFWAVLTQIDEKGKQVHKIPHIGPELWKRSRDWLYRNQLVDGKDDDNKVLPGYNLLLRHPDIPDSNEFHCGGLASLDQFTRFMEYEIEAEKARVKKVGGTKMVNNALESARKVVNEFYKARYSARQLPGDQIPF